jgi:hypothetical protein
VNVKYDVRRLRDSTDKFGVAAAKPTHARPPSNDRLRLIPNYSIHQMHLGMDHDMIGIVVGSELR